jgi:heme-degrading monooxygenase HmoA
MYIILRRYAGVAAQAEEGARRTQEGLVPMLREQDGFEGYAAFASDQGDIVSFSVFKDAAAAMNSQEAVRSWVVSSLRDIFPNPPETFMGVSHLHAISEPQSDSRGGSLYCMVAKSENVPPVDTMRPIVQEMIAALQKSAGFRGIYFARSQDDPTRSAAVLFADTRDHAMQAHESNLSILRKHQSNVSPKVVASGETMVLAMA